MAAEILMACMSVQAISWGNSTAVADLVVTSGFSKA